MRESSRIDVVCGPEVLETVLALTHRWGVEHGVDEVDQARLSTLVRAAVEHGGRFRPRGLSLLISRHEPGQVRIDLRWHGSSGSALVEGDVREIIATLDAFADRWGFSGSGTDPVHWMVVRAG
ncbi:hypothetical protein [uncultured Nocardioides sp.]|uniref:hypothetical protein n=1 Tax=uncultured Nocardioides sp. TaxID=198441 RepID=UPI002617D681|nr:hypothetical protein [uncultured Nocardioides sp.]HRD59420.1 hypothetical protein [Nocardioides sp.]